MIGEAFRRIDIIAGDTDDVPEIGDIVRGRDRDDRLSDVVDALKVAGRLDDDLGAAGVNLAARQDDVLCPERLDELIGRQAITSELGVGGLQKNPLLLDAEQGDFLDALDGVVGVAKALGDLVHLGKREAF